MGRFDVRRLAAVDMYGSAGAPARRWVILVEFVVGALGCVALGLWSYGSLSSVAGRIFSAWLVGVGLNYIPLALHAVSLSRPGALDRELAGVDVRGELRFYTTAQLWIVVPLLLVVLALQQRGRPAPSWDRSGP